MHMKAGNYLDLFARNLLLGDMILWWHNFLSIHVQKVSHALGCFQTMFVSYGVIIPTWISSTYCKSANSLWSFDESLMHNPLGMFVSSRKYSHFFWNWYVSTSCIWVVLHRSALAQFNFCYLLNFLGTLVVLLVSFCLYGFLSCVWYIGVACVSRISCVLSLISCVLSPCSAFCVVQFLLLYVIYFDLCAINPPPPLPTSTYIATRLILHRLTHQVWACPPTRSHLRMLPFG